MKHTTNVQKPKFGVKGYELQETTKLDPLYKIRGRTYLYEKDNKKGRGSFIDDFLKITKTH